MNDLVEEWPSAIISTGNNENRLNIHKMIKQIGYFVGKLIQRNAYVSPDSIIEDGCILRCFSCFGRFAVIRQGSIINIGAKVDRHFIIGEGYYLLIGTVVRDEKNIKPLTMLSVNQVIE